MVDFMIELLGIQDDRYIQFAYYAAVIMLPFTALLVWDGICSIFRSFTKFK